jgi:hypothetical protein
VLLLSYQGKGPRQKEIEQMFELTLTRQELWTLEIATTQKLTKVTDEATEAIISGDKNSYVALVESMKDLVRLRKKLNDLLGAY